MQSAFPAPAARPSSASSSRAITSGSGVAGLMRTTGPTRTRTRVRGPNGDSRRSSLPSIHTGTIGRPASRAMTAIHPPPRSHPRRDEIRRSGIAIGLSPASTSSLRSCRPARVSPNPGSTTKLNASGQHK